MPLVLRDAGLKTLTDHYAELGMDIHEELENRAQEMKLIKEIAERNGLSPQALFASFVAPMTPEPTPTDPGPEPEDFIAT